MCLATSGCGGQASTPTPTPAPTVLHGSAVSYVLRLDELPSAGFTTVTAPSLSTASALAGDAPAAAALQVDGLTGVASAHYVNEVADLATANGPLDVLATVATFSAASGAHAAIGRLEDELDAEPGAAAVSAGEIGAESHAITQTATTASGIQVVQVTVLWRVGSVVNEMAVRGRSGGTGIGDAVLVANRQAAGER